MPPTQLRRGKKKGAGEKKNRNERSKMFPPCFGKKGKKKKVRDASARNQRKKADRMDQKGKKMNQNQER